MIFNISGGGAIAGSGSGAGLNFRVVGGTTPPENPRENTIWVNTDTEITGWMFSSTEPSEPYEGMVWLHTGTYSITEFNALKKNGIQVCPLGAKQMISGNWEDKDANSNQNGEWLKWTMYLFNNGNECTDITGGWTSHNPSTSWTLSSIVTDSGNLEMKGAAIGEAAHRYGFVYTSKEIDLTNINYIKCNITQWIDGGNEGTKMIVAPLSALTSPVASVSIGMTGEISIDVSNLNASYAVGFRIGTSYHDDYVTVATNRIWLE